MEVEEQIENSTTITEQEVADLESEHNILDNELLENDSDIEFIDDLGDSDFDINEEDEEDEKDKDIVSQNSISLSNNLRFPNFVQEMERFVREYKLSIKKPLKFKFSL